MSPPEFNKASSIAASRPDVEISIGQATESDAPAISVIGTQTFTKTFGHAVAPTDLAVYLEKTYSAGSIVAELADPRKTTFVARLAPDGDMVGFIQLLRRETDPSVQGTPEELALLQKLYVDTNVQGKGVGSKLIAAVEERARTEGFRKMWLTVYEHIPNTIMMYERRGYRKTGMTEFVMGSTVHLDFVLEKLL